jgi:N-acetylneuraminate synthase
MWGSDQAASVEIGGLMRLVSNIRDIEKAMGDGIKRVYDEELPAKKKLRRIANADGSASDQARLIG